MRWILPFLMSLFGWNEGYAQTRVYVSLAGEKQIISYAFDPLNGKLTTPLKRDIEDEPGALAVDPQRRNMYVSLRPAGKIASYALQGEFGRLKHLNTIDAGADPAYMSVDPTGKYLLTAYYVANKVTVHAIDRHGALVKEPLQSIPTTDKAHGILVDAQKQFAFVPHTGPNAIYQFTFDAEKGRLNPAREPVLKTPEKTGPRHIVYHPYLDLAYIDNEQGGSVTLYQIDRRGETLKPLQTLSTLPENFRGNNACAELRMHPSGLLLFVANRGHDSIARFRLDPKDGKMTSLGQTPTEKTPRSFDVDPSGQFLIAAGEGSGKLATYRIDAKQGSLQALATYEVGKQPWWVTIVPLNTAP